VHLLQEDPQRVLVDRCLAGDGQAWNDLVRRFQPGLMSTVQRLLGKKARDAILVGDLVQEVWVLLWKNSCRLLRKFDGAKGDLPAYLASLARQKVHHHFLALNRKKSLHQRSLSQCQLDDLEIWEAPLDLLMEDFCPCLTPNERELVFEKALGNQQSAFSQDYASKLERSVLKKWNLFVAEARSNFGQY
jgi:DNA-directed RNA polymerase specialized sigma24 family protein